MKNRSSVAIIILSSAYLIGSEAIDTKKPVTKPENFLIEHCIKPRSHLTRADVKRWKLLLPGATPVVTAGVAWGGLAVAKAIYDIKSTHIRNFLASQSLPWLFNNITPPDRALLAIGGAVAALKLYNTLLRPRFKSTMIQKIKNYIQLCSRLTISQKKAESDRLLFSSDSYWREKSEEQLKEACDELIEQGKIACELIDRMQYYESNPQLSNMKQQVMEYMDIIEYNKKLIPAYIKDRGVISIDRLIREVLTAVILFPWFMLDSFLNTPSCN